MNMRTDWSTVLFEAGANCRSGLARCVRIYSTVEHFCNTACIRFVMRTPATTPVCLVRRLCMPHPWDTLAQSPIHGTEWVRRLVRSHKRRVAGTERCEVANKIAGMENLH